MLASGLSDLHQLLTAIRNVDAHSNIQLILRPDALARGLLADVLVPRARFSTELHGRISATVRRQLRGAMLHEHLALDERPAARLHYYCAVPPDVLARPPIETLQADLSALLRTWDDELRDVLARSGSPADADRLAARYARALPTTYKAGSSVADAARDVRCLEALCSTGRAQIEVVTDRAGDHALKLYLANAVWSCTATLSPSVAAYVIGSPGELCPTSTPHAFTRSPSQRPAAPISSGPRRA